MGTHIKWVSLLFYSVLTHMVEKLLFWLDFSREIFVFTITINYSLTTFFSLSGWICSHISRAKAGGSESSY